MVASVERTFETPPGSAPRDACVALRIRAVVRPTAVAAGDESAAEEGSATDAASGRNAARDAGKLEGRPGITFRGRSRVRAGSEGTYERRSGEIASAVTEVAAAA